MVSTHHGHFVKFFHAASLLNLCTCHFDSMKCIMYLLHLDNWRRDNELLYLTLLALTITRPCPRMRGLGLESGTRWTRRSPSVSTIGAARGSTRWLSSPTQPMENYLNKRYSFSCLNFQFPSNQIFWFNRKFSDIILHFPCSSINIILARNQWTWPLSDFIKLQLVRSTKTSKENGCNCGTERTRNGQPTDFL